MNKIGYALVRDKQVKTVLALIKAQLVTAVLVIIGCYWYSGFNLALSSGLGSVASVLPNLCFAYYSLRRQGASAKGSILANFFIGEFMKFALVICLLVTGYKMASSIGWLNPLGILIGFGVTYLSVLLVPLLVK